MSNILTKIIAHKQREVAERKGLYPTKLLERSLFFDGPTISLKEYLLRPDLSGIIAEFKRRSPSKPTLNLHAQVETVSIGYMMAGASALSVLTDTEFFGGQSSDLETARKFNYCPILRKDFIVDEYQVLEARAIGADAILLIAEALDAQQVKSLATLAHSLGLEVLMEVHSAPQLEKLCPEIDLVGVNNRNLDTFAVSTETSKKLAPLIPDSVVKISESGISSPEAILDLRGHGYKGFLIGEAFMKHSQPQKGCATFIQRLKKLESQTANPVNS